MVTHKLLAVVATVALWVGFAVQPAQALEMALPANASGQYELDTSHVNVIFKINHLGFSTYMGRFNSITGTLALDAANLPASEVNITIDPASIDTNNDKLEEKLRGDDFFKAASDDGKTISFKSTKIQQVAPTMGKITGELTMGGVTKEITLNTKLNGAGIHPYAGVYVVGFSAVAKLNRSDWGMKAYIPQVGDEVELIIEAEFMKKQ